MARRSVKTIRNDVDLSSVLKMPDELPKPFTPQLLFGSDAPLELEIGSGKGMFIRKAADQFPQHNFLGIEIGNKFARLCAARLLGREQHNAVMVCGDAALILQEYVPDDFLEAVHVYFPDPWWKRAHRKRRILRTEVLQLIEQKLRFGGALHFWTDVEEYFLSTLELLKERTKLLGPFDVPEKTAENEDDYRTHFERRTRLHGGTVFRCEFKRNNDCGTANEKNGETGRRKSGQTGNLTQA
ncbi:MAG: tRNA (guanosine(46)-N7)-methyltransferase TrmB [Planctomycetaceae bacterium]|jgi:tRNA (guanine-N7-)-methyltransferase|nr:tRNA (guanosine(46)-N7)-methyltransferase TrmB [Planctomycetaceae bacterium]